MKIGNKFRGTIEDAQAEVAKLKAAGFDVAVEVRIVAELAGYERVRERKPVAKRRGRAVVLSDTPVNASAAL